MVSRRAGQPGADRGGDARGSSSTARSVRATALRCRGEPGPRENGPIVTNQTQEASGLSVDVGDGLDGLRAGALGPTNRPMPNFPQAPPLHSHGPARIIAMCNQKGGVGKTTSTINLGAALAECGRKVLLVDFDPQGALSVGLGINPHELEKTIYNVLLERHIDVRTVVRATGFDRLDLLPANIDLSAAEVQLVGEVAR